MNDHRHQLRQMAAQETSVPLGSIVRRVWHGQLRVSLAPTVHRLVTPSLATVYSVIMESGVDSTTLLLPQV